MKTEKIKELYYTAGEARKILDLSDDKFQYWVRAGRIEKVQLPGRKQFYYPKRDVDKLARRIEAAIIAEEPEGLVYRKATIEDMEEEYHLSYLIFGKAAHSIATRQSFIEQNPDVNYHLYDHEKLAAFIQIIPYNQKAIKAFMSGANLGDKLSVKDIEQFAPNKPLECIIMEMDTTPTVPPGRRTLYGTQLLMGVSETFREWGEKGIIINKLYATSATPTGIRILKSADFQPVSELGIGDFGNIRYGYELDLNTTKVKMFRPYQEALRQFQAKLEAKQAKKI